IAAPSALRAQRGQVGPRFATCRARRSRVRANGRSARPLQGNPRGLGDASEGDEDLWFVQLPGGQVRAWDLDELDAAFQHGFVDESTILRRDGALHWQSLGELIEESDPTVQLTVRLKLRPLNSLAAYTLADRAGLPSGVDDFEALAPTTR